MVGQTDEAQNAFKIAQHTWSATIEVAQSFTLSTSTRRCDVTCIENSVVEQNLAFANTEDFDFFS